MYVYAVYLNISSSINTLKMKLKEVVGVGGTWYFNNMPPLRLIKHKMKQFASKRLILPLYESIIISYDG